MAKGIHRAAAGSKRARQMNNIGKPVNHFFRDPEIEEWNRRVDEKKNAMKIIQPKESK